jgi:hypothetical protein
MVSVKSIFVAMLATIIIGANCLSLPGENVQGRQSNSFGGSGLELSLTLAKEDVRVDEPLVVHFSTKNVTKMSHLHLDASLSID